MPTAPKKVAQTLKNILDHQDVIEIQNREVDISPVVDRVMGYWTYDLFGRKPSPAEYDDTGNLIQCTNLDLATFMYALADRGAVVVLPEYETMRAASKKEGQRVISDKNRHGKITGLTSNRNTFSFGIRIFDQNVITTDDVGDFRTFLITGLDGELYDGWKRIEFMPSAKENSFLNDNKLWQGQSVKFDRFVNPEKWISFYGKYYFISKLLVMRMVAERNHLDAERKRLIAGGATYPPKYAEEHKFFPKQTKDSGVSVKVSCLEVDLDVPEPNSGFVPYSISNDNLVAADVKYKQLGKARETLQFITRSVELAVNQMGFDHFPRWLQDVKWEDYTAKGKRTMWNRLVLFQPGVGERAVSIRQRTWEKSEKVNEAAAKKLISQGKAKAVEV